jgi:hypothetical protein
LAIETTLKQTSGGAMRLHLYNYYDGVLRQEHYIVKDFER